MIMNLGTMRKEDRIEPPQAEVETVKDFYIRRLASHGYQCRDENSFIALAAYFARYYFGIMHEIKPDSTRYSKPDHGMLLFGPCGSGKTKAFEIFSGIFQVQLVYADELIRQYATRGESGFWDYAEQFDYRDLIVDDLGSERDIKSYGNESVMIEFIYRRERQFRASGCLTHWSTNLKNNKEISDRYGSPAESRIVGMTTAILVNATDARKNERTS